MRSSFFAATFVRVSGAAVLAGLALAGDPVSRVQEPEVERAAPERSDESLADDPTLGVHERMSRLMRRIESDLKSADGLLWAASAGPREDGGDLAGSLHEAIEAGRRSVENIDRVIRLGRHPGLPGG